MRPRTSRSRKHYQRARFKGSRTLETLEAWYLPTLPGLTRWRGRQEIAIPGGVYDARFL